MFAVKNKDGLYYSKIALNDWHPSLRIAQKYDLYGATKSAERHNGEVVEIEMYRSSGHNCYFFREKRN